MCAVSAVLLCKRPYGKLGVLKMSLIIDPLASRNVLFDKM